MVFVAVRLDIVLGTDYIRNVVIIGYIANELISITDNSALLGLPVPNVILKAIDVLKSKSDEVK
jgi:toxin secretion/phage lysis holin